MSPSALCARSHDPSFDGTGFDGSEHSYELLVSRKGSAAEGSAAAASPSEPAARSGASEQPGELGQDDGAEVAIAPHGD